MIARGGSRADQVYNQPMGGPKQHNFVSRAGIKLAHGLDHFQLDVAGLTCADFGCNVGGFTDCLLQRGAAHVYAIDTGYGVLDYRLRIDNRVTVMERTNALHAEPPDARVDLVTIDLAWTPQRYAIPAALGWLKSGGRIVTLIKPHYELTEDQKQSLLVNGLLQPDDARAVLDRVLQAMPDLGVKVVDHVQSPITGKKSSSKPVEPGRIGAGNIEFLALCQSG